MKPIVITVDKDGKITMTTEEIKALLQDAFEQGRQSATHVYYEPYYPWWRRWNITTTPSITWTCGATATGSDINSINTNSYFTTGTISAEAET